MNNSINNNSSYFARLWQYQSERFPIFAHGLLITAFTFSAISFSILSRGAEGFIRLDYFLVGLMTTFSLFFMMRVLDEIKDKDVDAKYRNHLPVPRGLVSINELLLVGIGLATLTLGMIFIFYPKMIFLMIVVVTWLGLMTVEFFVPQFLNSRLLLYATSHMMIIPLIDIYASGLDWFLDGGRPHFGLVIFFALSFFNGLVIEIGRKIKTPADESEGVQTYTSVLGTNSGLFLWLTVSTITYLIAMYAISYVGISTASMVVLSIFYCVLIVVGIRFYRNKNSQNSKLIEHASGIWTLSMYLIIGGLPGLISLF